MTSATFPRRPNSIVERAEERRISLAEASRQLTLEHMAMSPGLQDLIALPLMCGTIFAVCFGAAKLI